MPIRDSLRFSMPGARWGSFAQGLVLLSLGAVATVGGIRYLQADYYYYFPQARWGLLDSFAVGSLLGGISLVVVGLLLIKRAQYTENGVRYWDIDRNDGVTLIVVSLLFGIIGFYPVIQIGDRNLVGDISILIFGVFLVVGIIVLAIS